MSKPTIYPSDYLICQNVDNHRQEYQGEGRTSYLRWLQNNEPNIVYTERYMQPRVCDLCHGSYMDCQEGCHSKLARGIPWGARGNFRMCLSCFEEKVGMKAWHSGITVVSRCLMLPD